ncbi:MAG TPA: AAA family ATPase [Candidatus Methylomirabilis sp.]|nr:AAA family ATPase [Candidatus Methylomirabilis sp.]
MPDRPPRAESRQTAEATSLAGSIKDPVGAFLKRRHAEGRTTAEAPEGTAASAIFHGLTPAHKAELLWEMYQELRAAKNVSPDNASLLAALYADEETQSAYQKGMKRHEDERKVVNGSYEQYRQVQKKIDRLETNYDQATRALFAKRGERTSAFDKLAYQKVQEHLDSSREELDQLLDRYPKLAARVSYDRMARMNKELTNDKFIWMPSRREILEQLENASLSGRPVLMVGESGTGKTSLVEAAAKRLTGQLPYKAQGGPSTRLQDSLASKAIKGDTSYLEYGPLGQALTGKESSLDEKPHHTGGVYFDDEFNNRPKAVQMEIVKAVSGVRPGHEARLPLLGKIDVQNEYLFIAAGNPAGERYEREATDTAVRREFSTAINVDYPEQSTNNPEWYESMVAALMDTNDRVRFAKSELEPGWDPTKEKVVEGGRKERVLSVDPKAGGALWRFAKATSELWNSFSRRETVLRSQGEGQYLSEFVLDPGVILGWLRQAVEQGEQGSLEGYLMSKIEDKLDEAGISKYDKELAWKFFKHYGLTSSIPSSKHAFEIMTLEEVGLLSPRVKYLKAEPVIEITSATAIINGKAVQYTKAKPEDVVTRQDPSGRNDVTLRGFTKKGDVVVESVRTREARLVAKDLFDQWPLVQPDKKTKKGKRRGESAPELEYVREAERTRLKEFFGKDFDVPPLPEGIDAERIKKWEELKFELRYLPSITLEESDTYPGWEKKPDKGINLFSILQQIKQLPENRANPHLKGLSPNQLPGSWVLKDTREKPNFDDGKQKYKDDGVIEGVLQKLGHGQRSNIDPNAFDDPKLWKALQKALKCEDIPGATVRLPRVIEANVMGQGPDFDKTTTWEWCEEHYGSGGRLLSGSSGSGGAAYVGARAEAADYVGFRPLVVFSSDIGTLDSGALELWSEKVRELREQESRKLSAFFEKTIDVPPLPAEITPDRLENWEKLGLELHYFPAEDMTNDRKLKAWTKKPNGWFYDQIANGQLPSSATQLPEGWFVVDGRKKPAYTNGDQIYDNDPLAPVLAELNLRGLIASKTRFSLHPTDFDRPEVMQALAEAIDLDPDQCTPTEEIVWNVLANIHHPEWGMTDTYEWQKESMTSGERLLSGGSSFGGATDVDARDRADDDVGFRPLGRFSP